MFDRAFDKIDVQSKALSAYTLRHTLISQNIANIETPGYKRKYINFDNILNARLNEAHLEMSTTNTKHISNTVAFDTGVLRENSTSMRIDKNNVNIDMEMAEQAKNIIRYNAVVNRVNSGFNRLKSAIKGGR